MSRIGKKPVSLPQGVTATVNGQTVAVSTHLVGATPQCPDNVDAPPAEPWSTDQLKTDCTGYFKLCYTLKAGDGKNPMPGDCEIVKVSPQRRHRVLRVVEIERQREQRLRRPAPRAALAASSRGGPPAAP